MVISHHHLHPHNSVGSARSSSSVAWLLQVYSLHMSVHLRPLLRQGTLVVYINAHTCKRGAIAQRQVQGSYSSTQLPDSHLHQLSNHSTTVCWPWNKCWRLKTRWQSDSLNEVYARRKLSVESTSPRLAQKIWQRNLLTTIVWVEGSSTWQAITSSFSESSSDTSHERPSSAQLLGRSCQTSSALRLSSSPGQQMHW